MTPPVCPHCGRVARLSTGAEVYGPGDWEQLKLWICLAYPVCDSYVGAGEGDVPKGTLANFGTRQARRALFTEIDSLSKQGYVNSYQAWEYSQQWLKGRKIAELDEEEAFDIAENIRNFRKRTYKKDYYNPNLWEDKNDF